MDYELVMPFVVTESHGGPYDDEAFAAGYEAGRIEATLGRDRKRIGAYAAPVPAGLVPQLDLIAMRHGFMCTADDGEDIDLDGWVQVVFRPVPSPDTTTEQP